jgi:hypothetical protein
MSAGPIRRMLGGDGEPMKCNETSTFSMHWFPSGAKVGDRCICGKIEKRECDPQIRDAPALIPGQVWERRDGSRVRIQGFSKTDRGWVKTREIGGQRERMQYPPIAFANGAFRLADA